MFKLFIALPLLSSPLPSSPLLSPPLLSYTLLYSTPLLSSLLLSPPPFSSPLLLSPPIPASSPRYSSWGTLLRVWHGVWPGGVVYGGVSAGRLLPLLSLPPWQLPDSSFSIKEQKRRTLFKQGRVAETTDQGG